MVLSSIAECRKALDYLAEVGESEEVCVVLRDAPCPVKSQVATETPVGFGWHQLVLRDDNTLTCPACGKVFRSKRRELTRLDRIAFGSLSPKVPFSQGVEQLLMHS